MSRCLSILVLLSLQGASARCQPVPPSPRRVVALDYPRFARNAHLQGVVSLAVGVAADGSVSSVRILFGASPLAEPARDVVRRWLFTVCAAGKKCEMNLTFSFRLIGSCSVGSYCPTTFQIDLPDHVSVISTVPSGGPVY